MKAAILSILKANASAAADLAQQVNIGDRTPISQQFGQHTLTVSRCVSVLIERYGMFDLRGRSMSSLAAI